MCYFYDNKCKNDFEICDHGPTLIDPRRTKVIPKGTGSPLSPCRNLSRTRYR